MKYGIGHLSIVPCRAEPSDASEQVTQLLFGETIKVYEKKGSWYRIKHTYDKYECWIDEKQFQFITQSVFEDLNSSEQKILADFAEVLINKSSNERMSILLGSNLSCLNKDAIHIGNDEWLFEGKVLSLNKKKPKNQLIENAILFLNAPYQWGGRSPFGIDCSGFTQLIYKLNGVKLPRDASQQAKIGTPLSFIEEAEEGDLAFFDNSEGIITHVGMILQGNRIIHASGKVRIDRLDHQGIFNNDKNDYTHRLRLITKVF